MDELKKVVEELRKLAEKATPAPWTVYSELDVGLSPTLFAGKMYGSGFGPIEPLSHDDQNLIEALRNALPLLLATADRCVKLEEALKRIDKIEKSSFLYSPQAMQEIARTALTPQEEQR